MAFLEAALVIRLRNVVRWDSALDDSGSTQVSVAGALHPVVAAQVFHPTDYQARDRQLAYRDLITAAAVVEVATHIGDVWNFKAEQPVLQGPVPHALPSDPLLLTSTGTETQVRHVAPTDVPFAAADQTDRDLYTRDALIYETLVQACATFTDPPLEEQVAIDGTQVWSLGEGQTQRQDVNTGLLLNQDLFRRADRYLADRDNQNAAYVARLAQVLRNPFEYAHRLYVGVEGEESREPDVYTLVSEGAERIWVSEPALSNRNRIVYSVADKTLQWTRERTDEVHVPQLFALSIPGLILGQTVRTVPQVPPAKDAYYWAQKARLVVPEGVEQIRTLYLDHVLSEEGVTQTSGASFTVPGSMEVSLPGSVEAGRYRVGFLVVPDTKVELAGASNNSETGGANGGATYEVTVASGDVEVKSYLVVGGSGLVYDGDTYAAGAILQGKPGITAYTQVSSTYPSSLRQYAVAWTVPLPKGTWQCRFTYTDLAGTSTGFGVSGKVSLGGAVQNVLSSAQPIPFSGAAGTLFESPSGLFNLDQAGPVTLELAWFSGEGQLHVRQVVFELLEVQESNVDLSVESDAGLARVSGLLQSNQPEVLLFDLDCGAQSPLDLTLRLESDPAENLLPIRIYSASAVELTTFDATPQAVGFQGWRQTCLDRAERAVQDSFAYLRRAYRNTLPTIYSSGTAWTAENTELWMGLLETKETRLRVLDSVSEVFPGRTYQVLTGPVTYDGDAYAVGEHLVGVTGETGFSGGTLAQVGAFRLPEPTDLGRPALVPRGLFFSGSTAWLPRSGTPEPELQACQPWMMRCKAYVADDDFALPLYS